MANFPLPPKPVKKHKPQPKRAPAPRTQRR